MHQEFIQFNNTKSFLAQKKSGEGGHEAIPHCQAKAAKA
jgi:hypothetical protein